MSRGRLILCATPIGNLADVTHRVLEVLATADVVACEDTRRTRKLLTHYGIQAQELVVYSEATERRRTAPLIERMRAGATVALVTDAGMPGLSDPGYRIVRASIDADIDVQVAPGPTAAISALALSGLPTARFVFEGFLPRKAGERRSRIAELAAETRTLVIYESPHRVAATVEALHEGLGERQAALARELTKLHEEVLRGSLSELARRLRDAPIKGEIVLVIEGRPGSGSGEIDPARLAADARSLMAEGIDRKQAMQTVARRAQVPRREVFDALLSDEEEGG